MADLSFPLAFLALWMPVIWAGLALCMLPVLLSSQIRELLTWPTGNEYLNYLLSIITLSTIHLLVFLIGAATVFSEGTILLQYAEATNILVPLAILVGILWRLDRQGRYSRGIALRIAAATAWYIALSSGFLAFLFILLLALFLPV